MQEITLGPVVGKLIERPYAGLNRAVFVMKELRVKTKTAKCAEHGP